MKKILAFILIALLSLTGCSASNIFYDSVGGNPTNNPNARYDGCLALDSYDDFTSAWSLMKEKDDDGKYEKKYSFDGNFGEEYTTVYYFCQNAAWITPTTDAEEYFENVDNPILTTYVFLTSEKCSGEYCDHNLFVEVTDEYYEYQKYPYIIIKKSGSLESDEIIQINDRDLLTMSKTSSIKSYCYKFEYDGVSVFELQSCVELDDATIDMLLSRLIALE